MKCSEWTLHIGFEKANVREKCKDLVAAQPALNQAFGGGDKLLTKYGTSGRFIVAHCKLTQSVLDKTGGSNGHSQKLLRLSKEVATAFPGMTDLEILGYYVNNHRTCQWKWVYDAHTNTGRLTLIPVFLQNKMCTTDMTIGKFSVYLAEWLDRMQGRVIGEIE